MIAILLITTGAFLYYSKSKYFPEYKKIYKSSPCINFMFIIVGTGLFIADWGWVGGILLALCVYMSAVVATQLAMVIKKHLGSKS